jgi:polysaccharide export outer membrane protein
MRSDTSQRRSGPFSCAKRTALAALALCLAVPATRLEAQEPSTKPDTSATAAYLVAPGDVLSLFVWKETDLTREVTVGVDGRISVPLVGDVLAEGKTTAELTADLRNQLSRFLSSPSVTVGVKQSNNSSFYVVGRVVKPGEYPLRGRTTFLQALAVAGGFAEFAKTDKVLIVRRKDNAADAAVFVDYKKLAQGEDLTQNLVLRPSDTIVVQ